MMKLPEGKVPGVIVPELKQEVRKETAPLMPKLPAVLGVAFWASSPATSNAAPPAVVKVPFKVLAMKGILSDVAQSIARRVEVTVTGEERARLVAAHHVSPEVYESYLKAKDELGKGESGKSIAYFEEAARKDPKFAPAYVSHLWLPVLVTSLLLDAYDGSAI
jgi:hypothetical protein